MKTYNTYQEAKIDNPNSDIYEREEGVFATESLHREPCKPKDYCITLESFLASGKRLVREDLFIGSQGKVSVVASPTAMSHPQDVDSDIYILKAKALEKPGHEWVNGDECEIEMYGERESYVFGCLVHGDRSRAIVFTNNGHMTIPVCRLLKPEAPEKKLERERRELINDTCEELFGDLPEQLRPDVVGTIEVMLDAGYRKEGKL